MRLIAISITIFTGALMASVGTVAEAIAEDTFRTNLLDIFGLLVVGVGLVLLVRELVLGSPAPAGSEAPQTSTSARSTAAA